MYIDLVTRVRNAQEKGKKYLKTPYSKMDKAVAELLEDRDFVDKVEVKGKSPKKVIKIFPNYDKPIRGVQFISKPSRRLYSGYEDIRPVKGGYGMLVLSTPKGVMSGENARREKVGGQLLFKVW